MRALIRLPPLTVAILLALAARAWAADPVVITQFRAAGPANGQFVELLNISGATETLPVAGWRLYATDATATHTCDLVSPAKAPALTLAPGQHWLVGQSGVAGADAGFASLSVAPCTGLYPAGGIAFGAGSIADSVGYGTILGAPVEGAPAPAPPTNGDAERRRNSGHQETESNAADFEVVAAVPQGSSVTDPAVAVAPAGAITGTTATLNGSENPHGQPVTACHFDLGTTAAYGATITCSPSPVGSSSAMSIAGSATSLKTATTYHYRLSITVAGGTFVSPDQQLTTLTPPSATTSAATGVSPTSATLQGTVNLHAAPLVSCEFHYGTTTAYGRTAPCSPAPSGNSNVHVSAGVGGLAPGATYHFQVSVASTAGTATGADRTFTASFRAPTVSTGPATSITATSAILDGTVNPHGVALSHCTFLYGKTSAYGHSAACATLPSADATAAVQAAIGGLAPSTRYHYALVAQSAAGRSVGADRTFTTAPPPPPAPTGYTAVASGIGPRSATVNGYVNARGAVVTDCHFDVGLARGGPVLLAAPCVPTPAGAVLVHVRASLVSLRPGVSYRFRLVARTAGGTFTGAVEVFTTRPPVAIYRTRIDRRHRRASFRFRSTVGPVLGFQCALTRIRAGVVTPRPRFRGCGSPQLYRHLARGRYIFYVRARGYSGYALRRLRV